MEPNSSQPNSYGSRIFGPRDLAVHYWNSGKRFQSRRLGSWNYRRFGCIQSFLYFRYLCASCRLANQKNRTVPGVCGHCILRNFRLHLGVFGTYFSQIIRNQCIFQVLIVISPNVVDVWEAVFTLLFFIILVAVSYSVDVQIWKKKQSDLQEELELAQEDGRKEEKPEKLSDDIRKWASTLSLNEDNAVVLESTPDVDTVRRWTRTLSQTYPTLSEQDQAKILAYRVSRTMVSRQLLKVAKLPFSSLMIVFTTVSELSDSCRLHGGRVKKRRYDQSRTGTVLIQDPEVSFIKIGSYTISRIPEKTIVEFSARVYRVDATDEQVSLKVRIVPSLCSRSQDCLHHIEGMLGWNHMKIIICFGVQISKFWRRKMRCHS